MTKSYFPSSSRGNLHLGLLFQTITKASIGTDMLKWESSSTSTRKRIILPCRKASMLFSISHAFYWHPGANRVEWSPTRSTPTRREDWQERPFCKGYLPWNTFWQWICGRTSDSDGLSYCVRNCDRMPLVFIRSMQDLVSLRKSCRPIQYSFSSCCCWQDKSIWTRFHGA